MQPYKQVVDDAVFDGKRLYDDTRGDDPRNEVRQVGNGLHCFLEPQMADFVKQYREEDRHDVPADGHFQETHDDRIAHRVSKQPVVKQVDEMFEAYEVLLEKRLADLIVDKRHVPSPYRNVTEYDDEYDDRERHQDELTLFYNRLKCGTAR